MTNAAATTAPPAVAPATSGAMDTDDDQPLPPPPSSLPNPPAPNVNPPETFVLTFTYPYPPECLPNPTSAPVKKLPNYTFASLPPKAERPSYASSPTVPLRSLTHDGTLILQGQQQEPEVKPAAALLEPSWATSSTITGQDDVPLRNFKDMLAFGKEIEQAYAVKVTIIPSRNHPTTGGGSGGPAGLGGSQKSGGSSRHHKDSEKNGDGVKVKAAGSDQSERVIHHERNNGHASSRAKLSATAPEFSSSSGITAGIAKHDPPAPAQHQQQQGLIPPQKTPSPPSHAGSSSSNSDEDGDDTIQVEVDSTDSIEVDAQDGDDEEKGDADRCDRSTTASQSDHKASVDVGDKTIDAGDGGARIQSQQVRSDGGKQQQSTAEEVADDEDEVCCAAWEFCLTGIWENVVAARADIFKCCKPLIRYAFRVSGDLIVSPSPGTSSDSPIDMTTSTFTGNADSGPATPEIIPAVRSRLDKLSSQTGTFITILSLTHTLTLALKDRYDEWQSKGKQIKGDGWDELMEMKKKREEVLRDGREFEVVIVGEEDAVEEAKRGLLVMIDELSGYVSCHLRVPPNIQPLLSGKKRAILLTLATQTGVEVYMPDPNLTALTEKQLYGAMASENTSPVSHQPTDDSGTDFPTQASQSRNASNEVLTMLPTALMGSLPKVQSNSSTAAAVTGGAFPDVDEADERVVMTGTFEDLQNVHNSLSKLTATKTTMARGEKIYALPKKLDYLLSRRRDLVKKIMHDNGTFVSLPPLGSDYNVIEVFSEDENARTRTMKQLMVLLCEVGCAAVNLSAMCSSEPLTAEVLRDRLQDIAFDTNTDLVIQDSRYELWGLIPDLKKGLEKIATLELFGAYQSDVQIQVEMSLDDEEFIKGKYCGKTRRIMRESEARLKLQNFNGYTLLVEIGGNQKTALAAYSLLMDELPINISFNIPYLHHRRLIGRWGDAIQQIMRKYSCFIRFGQTMSAYGSMEENEDNVFSQTPSKFSHNHNLLGMKYEVLLMIPEQDRDYTLTALDIPRQHHRALQLEKSANIKTIERQSGVTVFFPAPESGEDAIYVYGSNIMSRQARLLLRNLVNQDPAIDSIPRGIAPSIPIASKSYTASGRARSQTDYQVKPFRTRAMDNKAYGGGPARSMNMAGSNATRGTAFQAAQEAKLGPGKDFYYGYERWNKAIEDRGDVQRARSATMTSLGSSSSLDYDFDINPASPDSMTTKSTPMSPRGLSILTTPQEHWRQDTIQSQSDLEISPQNQNYNYAWTGSNNNGRGQHQLHASLDMSGGGNAVAAQPYQDDRFQSMNIGLAGNPGGGALGYSLNQAGASTRSIVGSGQKFGGGPSAGFGTYGSAAQAYQPDWVAESAAIVTGGIGGHHRSQMSMDGLGQGRRISVPEMGPGNPQGFVGLGMGNSAVGTTNFLRDDGISPAQAFAHPRVDVVNHGKAPHEAMMVSPTASVSGSISGSSAPISPQEMHHPGGKMYPQQGLMNGGMAAGQQGMMVGLGFSGLGGAMGLGGGMGVWSQQGN